MHVDQEPYRNIYDSILTYDGSDLYADIVRPWLRKQDGERRWLESFARRSGSPVPQATIEDLWRLYALSRIVELLQLGFAPPGMTRPGSWGTDPIGRADHAEFMDRFGLQKTESTGFHPFLHEIVTVAPAADPNAPVTILERYWPAYMLGPLVITRGGYAVTAGADTLNKEIAEQSTLYWAFARRHRPTADLSVGWGSNSQWRTAFRRDYRMDGLLHYNVDADTEDPYKDDLDPQERQELLRFRCFVRCAKSDEDRWPYDDSFVEEA